MCYNRAGYLDYLRQGWGYCGSWCSVGECPGDTCYGCSNVQSCSDSALAQGPPWNYRRLDEPREDVSWAPACEDAADKLVAQLSEEALGRTLSSCAEVKIVGGCDHEAAKMHCPASCGLCDSGWLARAEHRRQLDKCNA